MVGAEAAALAAERADREDIEKISKNMRESEDTEKAVAIHLSFLRSLVNATRNPVLSQIYNMITAFVAQSRPLSSAIQNMQEDERKTFLKDVFNSHKSILRAVESHNPVAARRAMKELLEFMEAMILKKEQRRKKGRRRT
jgi:DNA-binding FadR family transcriptional regulator